MCQNNCNTKSNSREGFRHLTYEDRIIIEHLYNVQEITNKAEIARKLGFDRSTISREIKKGLYEKKNSDWTYEEKYSADKGQMIKEKRAENKGPNLVIAGNDKLATYIEEKIKDGYSPEVIEHWIKKNDDFKITICAKTIYNYIHTGVLLIEEKDLVHGFYKKNKKKKEAKRTTAFKVGRRIHDRPEEAKEREEIGHWEMDLVEGKKGVKDPYLLVLTERASRQEIIEIIPNKTSNAVISGLDRIERRMGPVVFREVFKTITTDNGSEFKAYKGIETSFTKSSIKRTKLYYCDAYSSWQRGSNENQNRMIRRFLPKGSSFKNVTRRMVKRIQKFMNNYPRKMFNFKTSNEIFNQKSEYKIKIA
jgi:IS30 family transposase